MSNHLQPPKRKLNDTTIVDHSPAQLARVYVVLGWSVLPIRNGTKKPAESEWKERQETRATMGDILGWIGEGHGLGVVLGDVSQCWVCRDFDDANAYHRWAAAHPDFARSLPTAQTARGFHVFVRLAGSQKSLKYRDGEIRSNGNYVLVAPSVHPDGGRYRWIRPPNPQQVGRQESLSVTGLAADWSDGGNVTETTETTEVMSSVISVVSVTPDKHEEIVGAISETVPIGVGGRNDGVFRFARRVVGILGGQPSDTIVRRYALAWYDEAKSTIGTLDPGVTIADMMHAIRNVKKPDTGEPLLASVMEDALAMSQPEFVADLDEDCASVRLAKLVVELSRVSADGVFYLSCRKAADLAGFVVHTQASRVLNSWVDDGTLELVTRGKKGPPGSKASRYRFAGES